MPRSPSCSPGPNPDNCSNWGELKNAAADDHLAPRPRGLPCAVPEELDAGRSPVLDHDARRQRIRLHRQVVAVPCGAQISRRGAPAASAVGGGLERARTFLLPVVEVVVGR